MFGKFLIEIPACCGLSGQQDTVRQHGHSFRRHGAGSRRRQSQARPVFQHLPRQPRLRLRFAGRAPVHRRQQLCCLRLGPDRAAGAAWRRGTRRHPLSGVACASAGAADRRNGQPVRQRLCRREPEGEDPPDRAGDDGEPVARTRHDPLARLGLPGVLLLQEFYPACLLPRSRRRLRGVGEAALRARSGAADAGLLRRRDHAAPLRRRRQHRRVLGAADAGADLDLDLDGQAELALAVPAQRAALSAARHELRALRLHLLSRRPALRQALGRHRCAEGLWPQPDGQHPRRARAVRDEPVLAAAGDLVRCGRRRPARISCWRATPGACRSA